VGVIAVCVAGWDAYLQGKIRELKQDTERRLKQMESRVNDAEARVAAVTPPVSSRRRRQAAATAAATAPTTRPSAAPGTGK
ncbi:MAG TPA: hypothetical protein VH475_01505, partial [Tepidisphaeraceae bacterium]